MTDFSNGSAIVTTTGSDNQYSSFLIVDKKYIPIMVDNNYVKTDQNPIIADGRTLVPVRAATESMGCKVSWYGDSRTVVIEKDNISIEMAIGSSVLKVTKNGISSDIVLDVPPQLYGDRTMLPIRVIAENLGYLVTWDETLNTVMINSQQKVGQ